MERINQDIKDNRFSNVYLLTGTERYLVKQFKDKLKNALIDPSDSMNLSIYSGIDVNENEVIDTITTMPFFAERRVIIIEDTNWMKSSKKKKDEDSSKENEHEESSSSHEQLIGAINSLPDTSFLIVAESNVDKRSKLFKALSSKGHIAEFNAMDWPMLSKWIKSKCKKEGMVISDRAIELLLTRTDGEMQVIDYELEKLIIYKLGENSIDIEDVQELCPVSAQENIFAMIESVTNNNTRDAITMLHRLLQQKEAPNKILIMIAREYNKLLRLSSLLKQYSVEGKTAKSSIDIISKELDGIKPYFLTTKYIPQCKKYTSQKLQKAVDICVNADERIKFGKMTDVMSLELMIVELGQLIEG